MKIVVCVKQVPEVTNVQVDAVTGTLIREGVKSMLNPFCEYALDHAVRLTRQNPRGPWVNDPVELPAGAAVGSAEAAGWRWAVEGALARESLGAFIRFLDAAPAMFAAPAGLAWLPFRRQGGDLVEVRTGARTRALGAVPWETRRAA